MSESTGVSDVLVDYLLRGADGHRFESVVQALLAIRDEGKFVALGGIHDGGADGFLRTTLEDSGRPGHFVQISKQENASGKIRGTAERLREIGRDVRTITYWTSVRIPTLDILEDNLTTELKATIRIRDRSAFLQLVNHSKKTIAAFENAFRAEIFELSAHAQGLTDRPENFAADPSVFVFLQFETKERLGKGGLVVPVVDALIYWSLRDTDSDKGVLMARSEIKERIRSLFPGAAANLLPSVDSRLDALTAKSGTGDQRVRHHRPQDSFCLPYKMRLELAAKSADELKLHDDVRKSLAERAANAGATNPGAIAAVCERAIYKHFQEQGLLLAAFLEKRIDGVQIADQIVESELRAVAGTNEVQDAKSYSVALRVLREVFYTPNPDENEFLRRLSRTSLLLFSLKHSPRLIEYFNKMTGHFRLLIGTDIVVKALAESYLPDEHRHITNLLRVARACGARLILTQPVLKEVFTHLHASHLEFRNHYAAREQYMSPAIAAQGDRILIRTYFYVKMLLRKVTGWVHFVEHFVDADELAARSEKGEMQLQAYLTRTYSFEFMSRDECERGVDKAELAHLSAELQKRDPTRNALLAENDALMVLMVYAQRRLNREVEKYDGFGLSTWWLTKEYKVLAYTVDVVRRSGGTPFIMRPEFLLNFLTLAPNAVSAEGDVRDLLPSHVGLQIGEHLSGDQMHRLLAELDNWHSLPEARVQVKISDAVDKLKFDRLKRYETQLDIVGNQEADPIIVALREAGRSTRA
jgi:hypothetical protein